MIKLKKIGFLFVLVLAQACSDSGDDGGRDSTSTSNIDLLLVNTNGAKKGFTAQAASTSCEVRDNDANGAPTTEESGYCFTPVNILGSISSVVIGDFGSAGVRLLGGGNESGLDAVFGFNLFDLLNAEAFDGDDNIQDNALSRITGTSLSYYHIESVFAAAGEIWHVRYFFFNSSPSLASPFLGCNVGTDELGRLDEAAGELFTDVNFQKYDIMACLEATGVTCENESDFKWIDADDADYSLVSTRPTNPLQLKNLSNAAPANIFGQDDACSMGSNYPEYTFASMDIEFDVTNSPGSLSAAIDSGEKTYTYNGTTGNKLTATLEFDLTNMMFYPQSASLGTDLGATTTSNYKKTIRQNLNKILPKGLVVKKNRASRDTTYEYQHDVALTFEVSTEEIADSETEDSDESAPLRTTNFNQAGN